MRRTGPPPALPALSALSVLSVLSSVAVVVALGAPETAAGQKVPEKIQAQLQELNKLAMPGPLSRFHAKLEKVDGCLSCHEPDKKVIASRCLACHPEVKKRIAARTGVHRGVSDSCLPCHVEHAGRNVELRPINRVKFDHAEQAGFPLEGKHAALARDCGKCHKVRSFLTLAPACASCHPDKHQGKLGTECARCHAPAVPFKQTRASFDHAKAPFVLTGAHLKVACEKCHVQGKWKGLASAACSDCHRSPHTRPLGACATCHVTDGFRVGLKAGTIDHATTPFPLVGRHAALPCASCHGQARPKGSPARTACASCHADPHRGLFREGCASCHRETGFAGAPFEHKAKTAFPLEGKHAEKPCAACHKGIAPAVPVTPPASRVVDFRGPKASCATCHKDPHGNQFGTACEKCHDPRAFRLKDFRHPRFPDFYVGKHAKAACAQCHRVQETGGPRRFKATSLACANCHADPHLGQVGISCRPCHAPGAPGFPLSGFDHARTHFRLEGAHASLACAKCHKCEDAPWPDGRGTAIRLAGLSGSCVSCHRDVHGGKYDTRCARCHGMSTWKLKVKPHPEGGACLACHRADYDKTKTPPHEAVGYARGCTPCHGARDASWRLGTTTHEGWPLLGAHAKTSCASCHASGTWRSLSGSCVSCHLDEFQRTKNPVHGEKINPSTCEPCHLGSDEAWRR